MSRANPCLFDRPRPRDRLDDSAVYQVIHLHPAAPAKPEPGEACNGCGVCCASEPCPVGVLISRRREGACAALAWSQDQGLYRCGLVEDAEAHLPRGLRPAAALLARLAKRFIAAGVGCDCNLQVDVGLQ